MTSLGRTWTVSEAATATILVVASGVGPIVYAPGYPRFPDSVLSYVVVSLVVAAALWVTCMTAGRFRLPDWAAVCLLVATSMLFATWYSTWQPILGPSSDNVDALVVGVTQLANGRNPYDGLTFLGNELTAMLGGFIAAAPFVVLPMGMFVQQLFWFGALVAFVVRSSGIHAAAMVATMFMLSSWTQIAVPSGSDHWLVAVGVVIAGSWGYWVLRDDRGQLQWWLSSLAFGLALTSRFTVWIAVVPLLVLFWRQFGAKKAIRWFVPAGLLTAVLVLAPFAVSAEAYLNGPIAVAVDKAQAGTIPHSGPIVALVTLIVIGLLSWRVRDLAGAWLALCGGLATLTATVVLTKVPVVGWHVAVGSYETVAYNGAWLVIGLCALAIRRSAQAEKLPSPAAGSGTSAERAARSTDDLRGTAHSSRSSNLLRPGSERSR